MKEEELTLFDKRVHCFMGLFTKAQANSSALESTPYLHWLCHHASASLRLHGPMGLFSCESLERHNSFLRRFVRRSSNNHDPAFYAFHFEQLSHLFSCLSVKKRKYTLRSKTAAAASAAAASSSKAVPESDDEMEVVAEEVVDDPEEDTCLPDDCVGLHDAEDELEDFLSPPLS